jgi:hypothetical protein
MTWATRLQFAEEASGAPRCRTACAHEGPSLTTWHEIWAATARLGDPVSLRAVAVWARGLSIRPHIRR